jgi:hypothetical protein
MDPAATLKLVQGHIKAGARASGWRAMEHFSEAGDSLYEYWGWRERGGFEPKGGDAQARKLGDELSTAFEKHEEEEEKDRAVHQDFEANPKPRKKRPAKPARSYKTRPGVMDEEEEEDVLEGSLRWANLKTRLLNAF